MSKERVFPLKIAPNGECALKEQCNKHTTGDKSRMRVLYALDAEFRIAEPSLYMDSRFISAVQKAQAEGVTLEHVLQESKETNRGLYYLLSGLNYVCYHSFTEERGNIVRNNISLYVPVNIKKSIDGSIEGLICTDVTTAIPYQNRSVLAENYLTFAKSRF